MDKFIDVSSHNNNINWDAVKNSGVSGVIIKATEGTTFTDSFLRKHYDGAKKAGLRVGFYHYLRKSSSVSTQYHNFKDEIAGLDYDIKLVCDVENMSNNWGSGEAERFTREFVNLAKNDGIELLIYSGRAFIEEHFSPEFCSETYFWVAEYGTSQPKTVPKCGTWTAWQFTETGSINGVSGNCDINYVYEPENFYLDGHASGGNQNNQGGNSNEFRGVPKIRDLQVICNHINGSGIAEDGMWGPNTDNAVKNLPICRSGEPNIEELVIWVQLRVGCNPDGDYGPNTEEAVMTWQGNHSLTQDGVAGYNTYKSLALA